MQQYRLLVLTLGLEVVATEANMAMRILTASQQTDRIRGTGFDSRKCFN